MHALGRYILEQMDRQRISRADLIRRSGLSKQTVYNLLGDPRAYMDQTPQRKTIEGLARALSVPELDVLTAAAAAIGVQVVPSASPLAGATDAQLLDELRVRLEATYGEGDGDARHAAPMKRAGESPATEGKAAHRRGERRAEEVPAVPAPQDELDLAALDVPSEGIAAREAQDEDAERPDW